MKKILVFISVLFLTTQCYGATGWSKSKPAGADNPGTIDTSIGENNAALDLMLSNFTNCKISYTSATAISVSVGGVMVSNTAGTVRLMLANSAATSVTFTDIDTGAEEASTTYYVYAIGSATTDTVFTVKISKSASEPTGVTYYKRLGSFYNDASSNITQIDITNDNDTSTALLTYDSGWFAVSAGQWYSKTHNLRTTKFLAIVYGATDASGSDMGTIWCGYSGGKYGATLGGITTTTIGLRIYATGADILSNSSSTDVGMAYARIIMIALK